MNGTTFSESVINALQSLERKKEYLFIGTLQENEYTSTDKVDSNKTIVNKQYKLLINSIVEVGTKDNPSGGTLMYEFLKQLNEHKVTGEATEYNPASALEDKGDALTF